MVRADNLPFPMNTAPENQPADPKAPEWMLVVDDDRQAREMVVQCLSGTGVEVIGASSGVEALRILADRSDEPFLILIDVLMPGIDGLTLARRLLPRFKRTSISFMSGFATDHTLWPLELQNLNLLVKPFPVATLKGIVGSARAVYRLRGGA